MKIRKRSNEATGIPLKLLPAVIARQIRKMGAKIYRISVKRTRFHQYNVSVWTKTIHKELAPKEIAMLEPVPGAISGKSVRKPLGCAA
jgi:hypothetical protein